jgi:hypothetical protein
VKGDIATTIDVERVDSLLDQLDIIREKMIGVSSFAKSVDWLMLSKKQDIGNATFEPRREKFSLDVPGVCIPSPAEIDCEKLVHFRLVEGLSKKFDFPNCHSRASGNPG